MTLELQQVAKILPQAESYYHQNKLKDESLEKKDEVIDKLKMALAKTDLREIKYLDQLKIKDQVIEEVKPKWWQHPVIIAGEVLLALFVGIQIGG